MVRIISEGPSLTNVRMTEIEGYGATYKQRIIGLVGDVVELQDGVHKISLGAPHHYIFEFAITVAGSKVAVGGVSIRPENCSPELKASWPTPTPMLSTQHKGVTTIVLAEPNFGAPTGGGWCAGPLLVECQKRKVLLEIHSKPTGAEIWVDSKKQSSGTNQTVEIELCLDATFVDVLLRFPGAANCDRTVTLVGNSKASVNCSFVEAAKK